MFIAKGINFGTSKFMLFNKCLSFNIQIRSPILNANLFSSINHLFTQKNHFYSYKLYSSSFESRSPKKINVPEIPRNKLNFSFCTSSGPGGQNVNHVNTKAELRFSLDEADWISDELKERLKELYQNRINKDGDFIITSQKYRTQPQNLECCIRKLEEFLEEASKIPTERIPTEVPEYENKKRIENKRHRSKIKRFRSNNWSY